MTIDTAAVQAYLHQHIPLSRAMGIEVVRCAPDGVTLEAPLEPNLNHESNAFGGSISALATLTGWTWLYVRLRAHAAPGRIVIQRSEVHYLSPIQSTFRAHSQPVADAEWIRLEETIGRRGRGRITIGCNVEADATRAAVFEGRYVVLV